MNFIFLNKAKQTAKVCIFVLVVSALFISCGEMSLDVRTEFENEETLFIDMKLMATGALAEELNTDIENELELLNNFNSLDSDININYEDEVLNLSLKGSITGEEATKFLKDGCQSNLKTNDSTSTLLDLDSPILCLEMKDLGYAKEYRVSSSYFTSFLNSSENDLDELNALARMFPNMLKIKWSLEVPGQLIESNGKMLAGSTVEWEWNFKDLVSLANNQELTDSYAIYIIYSTTDLWSKVVRMSDVFSEQLTEKRQNILFGIPLVPVEKIVEVVKEVEVPVEKIVTKEVEVIKEIVNDVYVPVEKIVEVIKEVPVEVETIKEVIVEKEIIKEVPVEKIVMKEVEVIKEIPVEKIIIKEIPVEVIKEVIVEKEVIKEIYATPEPKKTSTCTSGDPSSVVVVPSTKIYEFGLTRYFYGSSNGTDANLNKYCQSPLLDSLLLEPIEERIPENPFVITGPDGVGEYGGTLNIICSCKNDERDMIFHDGLVALDLDGKTIVPNLADRWSLNDDGTIWNFSLRKGIKWSDGINLTSQDIEFSFDHLINDRRVNEKMPRIFVWDGKKAIFSRIDDYQLQFAFNSGYVGFLHGLSRLGAGSSIGTFQGELNWLISPAHYMKQYHVSFNSIVPQQALDEGYSNWVEFLKEHTIWYKAKGLKTPVITPWIAETSSSSDVWKLKRNPYFWVVDTVGNQLPYIDKVEATSMPSLELRNAAYLIGKADFAFENIQYNKVSTLVDLGKSGVFDVDLRPSHVQRAVMMFNQTYEQDSEISNLLRNSGFRRAIAFGINRERINQNIFDGIGVKRDAVPALWMEDYPGEDFANRYITYNPGASDSILNALGLWKQPGDSWRQRTDGGGAVDLTIYPVPNKLYDSTVVADLIADNMRAIGIRTTVVSTAVNPNTYQIIIDDLQTDMFFNSNSYVPLNEPYYPAIEVGKWYNSRGLFGKNPELNSHLSDFSTIFDFYQNGLSLSGIQRYENNIDIIRRSIDSLYWIGTVGDIPKVSIKNPSLKGVVKGPFIVYSHRYLFWFN